MFRYRNFKNIGYNNSETPAVYSYETTEDTISQISVSGYFSDPRAEIREGDLIVARCTDGSTTLTALNSDSVVAMPSAREVNQNIINTFINKKYQKLLCMLGNSQTEAKNNFIKLAISKLNGMYTIIKNAGIGGTTSKQGLDRINTDVPDESTVCTIMFAANDYTSTDPVISVEDHTNIYMTGMFNNLITRGIEPIHILSPPNDNLARSEYIYNCGLRDWLRCRELGIKSYFPHEPVIDPATGGWLSTMSDDGTHANDNGNYVTSEKLYTQIKNDEYYIPIARINGMTGAIMTNELLMTDSNSDNIPERFATSGTGTPLLSVTSLGLGNTYELAGVNSAIFSNTSRFTLTPGRRYLFSLRANIEVLSGVPEVTLALEYNDSTRIYLLQDMSVSVSDRTFAYEWDFPAGKTDCRFIMLANSGTYSAKIRIAQIQWFDLTSLGYGE